MQDEYHELTATVRPKIGKNTSKKHRQEGFLPSVIYGLEKSVLSILVPTKEIETILRKSGKNSIISLKINPDQQVEKVKVYELNTDAITGEFIHIDFIRVDLSKSVRSSVQIKFQGNAPGVKAGGVLVHKFSQVSVESLPQHVPSFVLVDISNLGIGDVFRVSDVQTNGQFKILLDPQDVLAQISSVRQEEAAPATEAAATPDPKAAAAAKQAPAKKADDAKKK